MTVLLHRLDAGDGRGLPAYDALRPDRPDAARLRLVMVTSADGSVVDARGRSGGLAGPADRAALSAQRALADGILVGAGTARAEGYGPHRPAAQLAERRAADGRPGPAPICVVTRSLELDPDGSLMVEARTPTVVITCRAALSAHPDRAEALGRHARLLACGDDEVDLAGAVRTLQGELGLAHLACEGGPRLATGLLAAGLVDELWLTLSPTLRGDPAAPRMVGALPGAVALHRHALLAAGDELIVAYRPNPPGERSDEPG